MKFSISILLLWYTPFLIAMEAKNFHFKYVVDAPAHEEVIQHASFNESNTFEKNELAVARNPLYWLKCQGHGYIFVVIIENEKTFSSLYRVARSLKADQGTAMLHVNEMGKLPLLYLVKGR